MDDRVQVFEALSASRIFREYASAFAEATGINVCLEAINDGADLSQHGAPRAAARVESGGLDRAYKAEVPVFDGARVIAWLRTGTIIDAKRQGHRVRGRGLRTVPAIRRDDFAPFLKLLSLFAQQLGALASQLVMQQAHCEPGMVLKAKQYIHAHYHEPLPLEEVAHHAHVSSYYLCKVFKKSTGINFSNYIARVRIEAAKDLLNKQRFRINEVAIEAGFQSLTHFNRVFKRFIGESPRAYRRRLPRCSPALQARALVTAGIRQ